MTNNTSLYMHQYCYFSAVEILKLKPTFLIKELLNYMSQIFLILHKTGRIVDFLIYLLEILN